MMSQVGQHSTYLHVQYLRGHPGDDVAGVGAEVGDGFPHDGRFEHVAAPSVLDVFTVVQIHHQSRRLVV